MTWNQKLPVGIDDFEKLRKEDFYYVDKTRLISDLLANWAEVNLFTRPRRFGKTLNMSMLRHFFEVGADSTLFDGLYISQNKELCATYMGKFPVIFVSLKGVDGLSFDGARRMLKTTIQTEAGRHRYLMESDKISSDEKDRLNKILYGEDEKIEDSLRFLSELLYKHYGKKTVILIDEYDVPLDKAFSHGYYDEMVALIRALLGQALKTNTSLQFAVLTGCLRVAKESIFTGLNNFEVSSITDTEHDEHFGFTENDVLTLLQNYHLMDFMDVIREWYDGYHFGNADIYCPWDVIRYVKKLRNNREAEPEAFWINTSGNDLVKRFVDMADQTTQNEIERLISGETIEKKIREELSYNEIDDNVDNLWSVLFTTGYLTQIGKVERGVYKLVIPNQEVREVFVDQIQEWFKHSVIKKEAPMKDIGPALYEGRAREAEQYLNMLLAKTVSVLDSKARDGQKENFYHGFLLGLLQSEPRWRVRSNVEAGEGFSDIIIEPEDIDAGIVIEVKYSPTFDNLEKMCEKALKQVKDRRYKEYLCNDGRVNVTTYGIAFCKKRCKVAVERL